ncbi:hypothetical protein K431DRAFT_143633 [Polychaeton citri CBS 116435]|uniref:Uncharacterized protein n=1 Tax=Polychaeton citri CBS 116435 TaxID=1314669 RepID=A0A9P4UMH0_9PEZI|nr:hypothetical protein K431DRAFT_143633 [Polychaeton citri CBS 116435]
MNSVSISGESARLGCLRYAKQKDLHLVLAAFQKAHHMPTREDPDQSSLSPLLSPLSVLLQLPIAHSLLPTRQATDHASHSREPGTVSGYSSESPTGELVAIISLAVEAGYLEPSLPSPTSAHTHMQQHKYNLPHDDSRKKVHGRQETLAHATVHHSDKNLGKAIQWFCFAVLHQLSAPEIHELLHTANHHHHHTIQIKTANWICLPPPPAVLHTETQQGSRTGFLHTYAYAPLGSVDDRRRQPLW